MLNKLAAFIRANRMISPGEKIICAVSGGADSIALLFAMKLLTDIWDFQLSAAHFNHHLRGEESDRDEAFVRRFCAQYEIPLYVSGAQVEAGPKGLEASARDARYQFLRTLPGKIATAHTADDNAETILMHLIRGTGLKGLGGITPVSDGLIRPMLSCTRKDVESFLAEYSLPHIEDSSNASDAFLRNRIRHHVMPLLTDENPRFSENISAMARNLRLDEAYLSSALSEEMPGAATLRTLAPALRRRYLERFLKSSGVREPEQSHLESMEALVFSDNPSAGCDFPGGIRIARQYDSFVKLEQSPALSPIVLPACGEVMLEVLGLAVQITPAAEPVNKPDCFTVVPHGAITLRSRMAGDIMCLSGGHKSLKKIFIDRKIPASRRTALPVIADADGILGVYGIGADVSRLGSGEDALCIRFVPLKQN